MQRIRCEKYASCACHRSRKQDDEAEQAGVRMRVGGGLGVGCVALMGSMGLQFVKPQGGHRRREQGGGRCQARGLEQHACVRWNWWQAVCRILSSAAVPVCVEVAGLTAGCCTAAMRQHHRSEACAWSGVCVVTQRCCRRVESCTDQHRPRLGWNWWDCGLAVGGLEQVGAADDKT